MAAILKKIFNINGTDNSNENLNPENQPGAIVCIVNDSVVMREGIKTIISGVYHIQDMVTTSRDNFFEKLENQNIDIVITDIEFEEKIDTTFIKQIKTFSPETRVVVYTRIKNHFHRNQSLNAGADFFIFWEERFQLLEHVISRMVAKIIGNQTN